MKRYFQIQVLIIVFASCNQNNWTSHKCNDTTYLENQRENVTKRISFKNVSEIVSDSRNSIWADLRDKEASLALHFHFKDTLSVSYSPECWLIYHYKIDSNKIIVYWDKNIDTKYDFDIVKAIRKIDKKYIGKPFMILELKNDTTFKATYLFKDLITSINKSSNHRTFFSDEFGIVQPVSYDHLYKSNP